MNISSMREMAFQCIYSLEVQKQKMSEDYIDLFIESEGITDKNAQNYIKTIAMGVANHEEEIESFIASNLKKDWNINRISKIDLSLLKLAIYEIQYKKLEYKIVINEAIVLSKQYSDIKVTKMINAMLDRFYHNEIEDKDGK